MTEYNLYLCQYYAFEPWLLKKWPHGDSSAVKLISNIQCSIDTAFLSYFVSWRKPTMNVTSKLHTGPLINYNGADKKTALEDFYGHYPDFEILSPFFRTVKTCVKWWEAKMKKEKLNWDQYVILMSY